MKFIEVKIYTSHQGVEPLTAMLMEKGISGVAVDDPQDAEELLDKKNEYEWDYIDRSLLENQEKEPVVSVFFEDTEEGRRQVQELKISVMMLKSKEMEGVFGWDAESDAATISVHVSNARAKLKAAGAEPVQTVWGVGYRWTA